MLFLFDRNTTKKSVQKHEFDVYFSQSLRGFLNSQIVAATSAGTFFESVGGRTIPSEGVPFDIGADRKSAPDL